MTCGFLYIAIGEMFRHEAVTSCRSLKRFTKFPVTLITDERGYTSPFFDTVIYAENIGRSFEVKITGMQLSPYDKTIFLDGDTFVCDSIDSVFDLLDRYDLAATLDTTGHSMGFWEQYKPDYVIRLKGLLYEYHTGVVAYSKSPAAKAFFSVWLRIHRELNILADMPTFREALFESDVRIATLPPEYNFTGVKSMAIAYGKVRVIHERLGEKLNNLRAHMASFEQMDKFARRLNRYEIKRLVIPYIGIIPYYYSPYYIKRKLKQLLGVKARKKRETFVVKS